MDPRRGPPRFPRSAHGSFLSDFVGAASAADSASLTFALCARCLFCARSGALPLVTAAVVVGDSRPPAERSLPPRVYPRLTSGDIREGGRAAPGHPHGGRPTGGSGACPGPGTREEEPGEQPGPAAPGHVLPLPTAPLPEARSIEGASPSDPRKRSGALPRKGSCYKNDKESMCRIVLIYLLRTA